MSTSYHIYAILPAFPNQALLMKTIHRLLIRSGTYCDEYCFLYATASSEMDIDPIDITDPDAAVIEMISNRQLGSMDYWILDHMITIAYKFSKADIMEAIKISIPDSRFEGSNLKFYATLTDE